MYPTLPPTPLCWEEVEQLPKREKRKKKKNPGANFYINRSDCLQRGKLDKYFCQESRMRGKTFKWRSKMKNEKKKEIKVK